MTPEKIYFDFIRCEDKSADLYLDLSVHFYHQIDLSWFWVDMAMAEKQRAGLLHHCLENRVFGAGFARSHRNSWPGTAIGGTEPARVGSNSQPGWGVRYRDPG
jgi:hypothetical protein